MYVCASNNIPDRVNYNVSLYTDSNSLPSFLSRTGESGRLKIWSTDAPVIPTPPVRSKKHFFTSGRPTEKKKKYSDAATVDVQTRELPTYLFVMQ